MNKEKLIQEITRGKYTITRGGDDYISVEYVKEIIQSEPEETCTYTRDDETNAWECSECGLTWVFMEDYTTPEENDMYYCPKCGRKIKAGE